MELALIIYLGIGATLAFCVVGLGLTEEIPRQQNPIQCVTTMMISGVIAVIFAFVWFPVFCNTIIKISRRRENNNVDHLSKTKKLRSSLIRIDS